MEIPMNAQVECTDGICGRSEYVLINPVIKKVTHLVVKEDAAPNIEYIVPIEFVTKTIADTIQLRCSKADLKKMKLFMKTEFIEENAPADNLGGYGMYGMGALYYYPYTILDTKVIEHEEIQQIPLGELAIHRGTRVEGSDGYVGKVDEFVVDAKTSHITHLVMREGHLWGKKDVIIPVSAISESSGEVVRLKLDKHQIEALPTFPLQRLWG
jgi:sporulation protein YlmC with PRC-barrel domain